MDCHHSVGRESPFPKAGLLSGLAVGEALDRHYKAPMPVEKHGRPRTTSDVKGQHFSEADLPIDDDKRMFPTRRLPPYVRRTMTIVTRGP